MPRSVRVARSLTLTRVQWHLDKNPYGHNRCGANRVETLGLRSRAPDAGSGKPGAWKLDDSDLIRRVTERQDEEAFRILYGRHTAAVYGLLCRLAGRSADASDLMHETWLRAVRHLALFRGQSTFRTWLTGIALNCYRDWRRRHARDAGGFDADTHPAPAETPDEAGVVNAVLARLTPEHRETIVLHDIEGFTHEDIAAALEIEPGTSKSRLSRARRAFRQRSAGTRP